jgi:hypothetical protein
MPRLLGPALFLAAFAAGCSPRFAAGVMLGVAITQLPPREPVVVVETEPTEWTPTVDPGAAAPTPPNELPEPFDTAAAQARLDELDVARCREHGLPNGYVHARFTFAPSGRAQRIVIDSPGGIGPDALACLRDTLSPAAVPPFTGAPVLTGHTWFLR